MSDRWIYLLSNFIQIVQYLKRKNPSYRERDSVGQDGAAFLPHIVVPAPSVQPLPLPVAFVPTVHLFPGSFLPLLQLPIILFMSMSSYLSSCLLSLVSPSISTPHPPCKQLLAAVVLGAGLWWCCGGQPLPSSLLLTSIP